MTELPAMQQQFPAPPKLAIEISWLEFQQNGDIQLRNLVRDRMKKAEAK